jgi:membrane associated rhomboid family serine protease
MLCSLRCSTRRLLVPNAVGIKSYLSKNSLRRYHFQSQINSNSDKIIPSIIALNGIVFAGWYLSFRDIKLQTWMRKHFSLTQLGIFREGNLHTLVTSFFSHYDPIHLLSNMIVLYSFGQNAINILGGYRFLALYFGGGLVSSVCHLLWPYVVPRHWPARYSQNRFAGGLGASGAVNSIVMFHILTYPRHMLYFFGVVPVPAALAGAAFVGMDLFGLYTGSSSYGNAAHLGGAALGAGVAMYLRRRRFR